MLLSECVPEVTLVPLALFGWSQLDLATPQGVPGCEVLFFERRERDAWLPRLGGDGLAA